MTSTQDLENASSKQYPNHVAEDDDKDKIVFQLNMPEM